MEYDWDKMTGALLFRSNKELFLKGYNFWEKFPQMILLMLNQIHFYLDIYKLILFK